MRVIIYLLILIAIGLVIYNITFLDFNNLFEGESAVAAIGIMAALCSIVLLILLLASRKFSKRKK